jgi:hypothetical protein
MTLELELLLLESVLLVATIILLAYSIHEGRQRENLLKEVGKATKILSRQDYFFSVLESMLGAKKEIIGCITGRAPSGDDIQMTRDIVGAIASMTKKGVQIKYLLPKFPDRLQIGVQYSRAGAQVYFSGCLMVHNLRYSVIDERIVVIGIPESTGEMEETKKGYKIPSSELALILKNYFNTCEKQASIKEYLREIIEQTGATPEHLAREFHVDEKELKRLAS